MVNWPTKKLEEIAKVEWGNTSITKKRYVPHGFLAISAAGPDGFLPFADYEGPAIILSAIGAKCGKCFLVDGKWTAIKNTIVVQPDQEQVDIKYLFYFVNDENKWQRVKAAAQPFISLKNAKELQIPLPPLSEQKKIVEKIEKLFAKINEAERLRAESLAASAALLPSALYQIFSRAKKENWPTKKLGEVCDILDSLRKPVTKRDRKPGPYPYYGATGVQDYVADYIFDEPLVLVGEDGAKWGSGEETAYRVEGKYWVNNHAHVLRPHRNKILDGWLTHFLNISDLSEYITGLTVKKLNQEKLRSIKIPLPPLSEQKKIIACLDALSQKSSELQKLQRETAADFSALRQSVLAQAFNQN
jgi:restriction endonuclease S subunit